MAYLVTRHPLVEVSELYPREAMNSIVRSDIAKIMSQVEDPEIRSDLERLSRLDFTGYIDRSLRSAGFDESELDALTHDIVVKLVVSPGGLVSKWRRDAPLSFRFKRAVKNAITTLAERASKRRRRFGELPDDQIASDSTRDDDDLVKDFRRWLGKTLGPSAVVVLDARLEGQDIKDVIGKAVGIPSAYALKRLVQQIKASAMRWPEGDPAFQAKVRRLMDAEQETLTKRFGRTGVAVNHIPYRGWA